ncbi:MAG: hypothetical protein RJQ04_18470 [Longimicrobiales bacterium]
MECFALRWGAWSPPLTSLTNAPLQTPPPVFWLTDRRGTGVGDRGQLLAGPRHVDRPDARATWRRTPGDTLVVTWLSPSMGVELSATASGDSLVGSLRALSDHEHSGRPPRADAVVRRTACPA